MWMRGLTKRWGPQRQHLHKEGELVVFLPMQPDVDFIEEFFVFLGTLGFGSDTWGRTVRLAAITADIDVTVDDFS